MPYLKHPPIGDLIRSIPVSEHLVKIEADDWREPCHSAGCASEFNEIFRGCESVTISRSWLHTTVDLEPTIRCLAILLWGYPYGTHSRLHLQWLARLDDIATEASARGRPWSQYYSKLNGLGGIGISVASKLACFTGQTFEENKALILDLRILRVISSGRWPEFAELRDISYSNAPQHYERYLKTLVNISETGGFSSEQLEFFLYALGDLF